MLRRFERQGLLFACLLAALASGCATRGHRETAARPAAAPAYHAPIWPIQVPEARITSTFGPRKHPITGEVRLHKGIDISAPEDTPVYATSDGRVVFSGEQRGYGNIVILSHAGDLESAYGHLKRRRVREGDAVRQGQQIGDVGRTGTATGFHLQYEVRRQGEPVDPLPYLPGSVYASSRR
ncbi:MAG: peptidoglycan DD-metalloendopeptidase family protein [Candidatus Hydrogenedens sp.]|nr:peptidoglycan DD-metalloendopeptidase family protein [Candidatus Hydrogenedens sp.]